MFEAQALPDPVCLHCYLTYVELGHIMKIHPACLQSLFDMVAKGFALLH